VQGNCAPGGLPLGICAGHPTVKGCQSTPLEHATGHLHVGDMGEVPPFPELPPFLTNQTPPQSTLFFLPGSCTQPLAPVFWGCHDERW